MPFFLYSHLCSLPETQIKRREEKKKKRCVPSLDTYLLPGSTEQASTGKAPACHQYLHFHFPHPKAIKAGRHLNHHRAKWHLSSLQNHPQSSGQGGCPIPALPGLSHLQPAHPQHTPFSEQFATSSKESSQLISQDNIPAVHG